MAELYERRYQVFISSTFSDLQEERQKVLQAILEMKAFPAGMELFPAADNEQWDFIRGEIDSSDYYVVVVAGKYGSLASDGISFTEKEYDYAVQSQKPVMAFLFHDPDQLKGSQLESEPQRREKLQAFRLKVSKSKLVKSFRNSDDLKSQVWFALTHAFQLQPRDGWVRGKNARRFEDLEEINRLQRRVMELEKDPQSLLAQGDEQIAWTISSSSGSFEIQTTWNQLLVALFRNYVPKTSEGTIEVAIVSMCNSQMGGVPWKPAKSGIGGPELRPIINDIRVQFLGLGYIEISKQEGYTEVWELTAKGRVQLALQIGKTRPVSA